MGKIYSPPKGKREFYSVQKVSIIFIVSRYFFTNFYYFTTKNESCCLERNKAVFCCADSGAAFCGHISVFTDEKCKENEHLLYTIKGPLTIYTFCSNFAHFAPETPSEKHIKRTTLV